MSKIEIQTQQYIRFGASATFTFSDVVAQFVVGIKSFDLSFALNQNQQIRLLSIILNYEQNEDTVTVTVQGAMEGNNGMSLDTGESAVDVVCIALTGPYDGANVLTNLNGVQQGGGSAVSFPNSVIQQSVLSGFSFDYGSGNFYNFLSAALGTSATSPATSELLVSGNASMNDATGHNATCIVNAGVIATSNQEPGFAIKQISGQFEGQGLSVTFDELQEITTAAVLIQDFSVSYGGTNDYWIAQIGVAVGDVTISGNTVKIWNAYSIVADTSGHYNDNSVSNVNLCVIVTYPSKS